MDYLHLNSTQFGLIQIPVFAGFIGGAQVLRKLTERYDLKQLLNAGFILLFIVGVISFIFSFVPIPSVLMWGMIGGMSLFNFGLAIFGAPTTRLVLEATDKLKGVASGLNSFITLGVSAIGLGLISALHLQNPILFSICLFTPLMLAILLKMLVL